MMHELQEKEVIRTIKLGERVSIIVFAISSLYFTFSCLSDSKDYFTQSEGFALMFIVAGILVWLHTRNLKLLLFKFTEVDQDDLR